MGQTQAKKERKNVTVEETAAFMEKFKKAAEGRDKISREQFVKNYTIFSEYSAQFYYRLMKNEPTGAVHAKTLLKFIDKGLSHYDGLATALIYGFGDTKEQIMRNVVKMFCEANGFNREDQVRLYEYFEAANTYETHRIEAFLSQCTLFANMATFIFEKLVGRPGDTKMPLITGGKSAIFGKVDELVINSYLPFDRRKEWTLLYSNATMGHSFSQMVKRVNGEGPALVLIRSAKGRRFGFFADHGMISGPQYHGTSQSFLFQCAPKICVFNSTERNENYAYLNFGQKQLPNGMGMSGEGDVWPIFVHEDFTTGICQKNSSSYEKCFIAEEAEFQIKSFEVWRVGEKPQKTFDELMESPKRDEKSIIDKDPEAKAVLELAGRSMHSEAYREPAPLLADE